MRTKEKSKGTILQQKFHPYNLINLIISNILKAFLQASCLSPSINQSFPRHKHPPLSPIIQNIQANWCRRSRNEMCSTTQILLHLIWRNFSRTIVFQIPKSCRDAHKFHGGEQSSFESFPLLGWRGVVTTPSGWCKLWEKCLFLHHPVYTRR